MSRIRRAVAAMLLAGAVAGAAAFAHLLGSEPAPGPFASAALPRAPASPLIVQAAPWSPERPAAPVHALRPAVHEPPPPTAPAAARPIFSSPSHAASTTPSAPLPAPSAQVAPRPPAPAPATPQPAASQPAASQPAASQPAASAPVAAPAPTPTPAARVLAKAASGEGRHLADHGRRGHDAQDKRADGRSDGPGNAGRGSNCPTVPGAAVLDAVPVDTATPTPDVTPPLPPVDPPSIDVTLADSGGHDHGRYGHGPGNDDWRDNGHDNGHDNNGHADATG